MSEESWVNRRANNLTGLTTNLSNPQNWFLQWAGIQTPNQPVVVNEHTALNYAALYTCVSLIAGTIAALPFKVYKRRQDGGQDEASDHPANRMFQLEYNPNTSSMTGRETELAHMLTWGNSYTQILRTRRGEIDRLQPIGPDVCTPRIAANKELVYDVKISESEPVTLGRSEVLHTPYFSFDSLCGMSPVRIARPVIRAGLSMDRQADRFMTAGFRPPGAIKFKAGSKFKTTQEAQAWRDRFNAIHLTQDGERQVVILEDGADWQQIGVNPETAQLLESRKFNRGEIAGFYKVPPHLAGDIEKTTAWGTGIEELNIGFVVYCLLPILRRVEQERNRKLFDFGSGLFCEHVLSGLLRGDSLKRAQSLEVLCRNGIITVNEWRRLEGFNPLPGGDVRYFPLNMGRVDREGNTISADPAMQQAKVAIPANTAKSFDPIPSLRLALSSEVSRCLRKEIAAASQAVKKLDFVAWVDEFYQSHQSMVEENCGHIASAICAMMGRDPAGEPLRFAAEHCERSRQELLSAAECSAAELPASIDRLGKRWISERVAETVSKLTERINETEVAV